MWCSKNNNRIAYAAIYVSTSVSLGLVDKWKNQVSYYFYQTLSNYILIVLISADHDLFLEAPLPAKACTKMTFITQVYCVV